MVEHPHEEKQVSISSTQTLSAGPSLRRLRRAPRAALQAALSMGQPPMDEHPDDDDDDDDDDEHHPQGPFADRPPPPQKSASA